MLLARITALLMLVMSLGGCITTPASRPAPGTASDPALLTSWRASGRIGVTGEGGRGGSGSFDWQQRVDAADVQIRGPIGIGSVMLQMRGDPAQPQLSLQTGDQVLEADAAISELEARLGAVIPAGRLRYWMLGLAAPGEHQWSEPDASGVVVLQQEGWRIAYQRYSTEFGPRLPMRIQASSGAARVRIVIDRWQLI
jgi:outer membrane lipoprotein LolB